MGETNVGTGGLTYKHDCVWGNRPLVGTCCIAQQAQLGALVNRDGWDGAVGSGLKREWICIYIYLLYLIVKQLYCWVF